MIRRSLICLALLLCIGSSVKAQSHSAALTWTLSSDDTTTACAVTGANCSQAAYRAPGACSSTSVFTALSSSLAATATTYTDSTIVPGQYCYAVTFTIGGLTSVIYQAGNTNFTAVSLQPAVPSALSVVVH